MNAEKVQQTQNAGKEEIRQENKLTYQLSCCNMAKLKISTPQPLECQDAVLMKEPRLQELTGNETISGYKFFSAK